MVEINASKGLLLKPQGSAPTAIQGTLYFDNAGSKLKICNTAGSFDDVGDPSIVTDIQEHEIEIIELQANASVSPFDHDSMISDTFSDADGYEGSVQIGTTTATFDGGNNKYKRVGGASGIIAYYKLESSGVSEASSPAMDTTGVNSPTYSAGKINNALDCSSTGPKYCKNDSATGSLVASIKTIEFWFKLSNTTANHAIGIGRDSNNQFTIGAENLGGYKLYSALIIGGSVIWEKGGSILTTGTWYHVICVFGTGGFKIYLNGNTTPDVTDPDTTTFPSDWERVYLGARSEPSAYLDGQLDNVIFWDNQFGAPEVIDAYNAGAGREPVTGDVTRIIDIDLGTISGTVVATQLLANCPDRESGDDVTYKLKNATQSDADLVLNTKNSLVNLTTNPTGIEINLVPKGTGPTTGVPSCKTYCLKVWKS